MAPKTPHDRPLPAARERILLAAHDLFYRDGIRATGIDRVIADAGVTKVTFYRHFPSKNDLVEAFLEYRHGLWMAWFAAALERQGAVGRPGVAALVPALGAWFRNGGYRGCAFLNTVVELGDVLPGAGEIARRHKKQMTALIASLLPPSAHRLGDAQAIALAVDGAILRAQMDASPTLALKGLKRVVQAITADP
ncbi:MAG: TetR family transcriptional regulator [Thiomonas sp. 13-66-29]|jgi:AcrR family transcriptional regulator|nr:MAG: TetR family transcriptional regulator [Thiomonas sp. 13-66-29]